MNRLFALSLIVLAFSAIGCREKSENSAEVAPKAADPLDGLEKEEIGDIVIYKNAAAVEAEKRYEESHHMMIFGGVNGEPDRVVDTRTMAVKNHFGMEQHDGEMYMRQDYLPEFFTVQTHGEDFPRIVIDGSPLVYDAKEKMYRHIGKFGPLAFFEFGRRGDEVYTKLYPSERIGVFGKKRIYQKYDPTSRTWTDTDWFFDHDKEPEPPAPVVEPDPKPKTET